MASFDSLFRSAPSAPFSSSDSLDRTACKLVLDYGRDAAIVAYTKAVLCETEAQTVEARKWRGVLGRVAAIGSALDASREGASQVAN